MMIMAELNKLKKEINILGNALMTIINFQTQKYGYGTLENAFFLNLKQQIDSALYDLEAQAKEKE